MEIQKIKFLETLCNSYGPSGFELEVLKIWKKYLNENGFPRVEIPELGEVVELTEDRLKTTPQYFLPKNGKDENHVEQGE